MGIFLDTTICEVVNNINESFFLPDIQREYVWLNNEDERKIELLFDSIMRGYPIGSFLFWKLNVSDLESNSTESINSDKLNFQLYKFIEDFDARSPHNEKIDVSKLKSSSLTVVLDGQQRLTSLFIGLKGSRTLKRKKARWDNPNAYDKKKLYLNLRYKEDYSNSEHYNFKFFSDVEVPKPDENNYWFKVGDILNTDSIFSYCFDHNIASNEGQILETLKNAICNKSLISYFEEKDKNLDKVLNIFIRVNSGGTQLSYSDLLMSILTANFSTDIREVMNLFLDNIKERGFEVFTRDHILKTCLLLINANHKFILKNFNRENIQKIENNWENITNKIINAIDIADALGYKNRLSSGYIISVIALYLNKNDLTSKDISKNNEDRQAIWKFIKTSQITAFFTTALDNKLSIVVEKMEDAKNFEDFYINMSTIASFKINKDKLEELLISQYSSRNFVIFPLLQELYPDLDYANSKFHIDHIFPKSKFTSSNKQLSQEFLDDKNFLFNLQLLPGDENIDKSNKSPKEWLEEYFGGDVDKINSFKIKNYIDPDISLSWEDFGKFKENRIKNIERALKKIFLQ